MTCFFAPKGENETLKDVWIRILCYLCAYLWKNRQIITTESEKVIWKQKKVRFLLSERCYNLWTSWFREKHRKTSFSQRTEKHETCTFFQEKHGFLLVFLRKSAFSDNSGIYRNDLCAVFWYFCSFHSLVLFVGRNDGFDVWNNDNFFKILWSNLINFDKEYEIYQIPIMSER